MTCHVLDYLTPECYNKRRLGLCENLKSIILSIDQYRLLKYIYWIIFSENILKDHSTANTSKLLFI